VGAESPEQLLARVGGGDAVAFGELWTRLGRPVLALAMRELGERPAAEDATQETFATVWRAAGTFDPERGTALAWIFTIARNAARDIARRRRIPPVPDAPEVEDASAGPDEHALRSEDRYMVQAALAGLSAKNREVIELAYYEGLSQTEIAARIAVPLGTVKTRTRNALAKLAGTLTEVGEAL
jgi:RNA polymerase sigma-70 factor (ECF subfamily)